MERYNYYIYSPSKSYGSRPNFVTNAELGAREGFASLYAVTHSTAAALVEAGTTAGYQGVVGDETNTLWLDVDGPEAAQRVEAKLKEMGYEYHLYSSGGVGHFHFGIHRTHSPSHVLPAKDKLWAQAHFGKDIDATIYTPLHLLRLPGTRHEISGGIKRLLVSGGQKRLELPELERKEIPKTYYTTNDSESVFLSQRVAANTVPAPVGERHATLVRLAYALRDDTQVEDEAALWYMQEVNKMFSESKSEEQVKQIFRSIFG